jgi:hypothetical protein
MNDDESAADALCPSWASSLGYGGVAAAVVLSNWGSAVRFEKWGLGIGVRSHRVWCILIGRELNLRTPEYSLLLMGIKRKSWCVFTMRGLFAAVVCVGCLFFVTVGWVRRYYMHFS